MAINGKNLRDVENLLPNTKMALFSQQGHQLAIPIMGTFEGTALNANWMDIAEADLKENTPVIAMQQDGKTYVLPVQSENIDTYPQPLTMSTYKGDSSYIGISLEYCSVNDNFVVPEITSIQYRTNRHQWRTYTIGEVIWLHGDDYVVQWRSFERFARSSSASEINYYLQFKEHYIDNKPIGGITLSGHLKSIDNYQEDGGVFYRLFANFKSISNAGDLIVPKGQMAYRGFCEMFLNTNIATAPALPSTQLAEECYMSMFQGALQLSSAPVLPATTLAKGCYRYMFKQTHRLVYTVGGILLPAESPVEECYWGMFESSSNLPKIEMRLKGTAYACFKYMFKNATLDTAALIGFPAGDYAAGYCCESMFEGASGKIGVELPATNLMAYCYKAMYKDTYLNSISLPAEQLVQGCYEEMFSGCNNLSSLEVAFTDWGGIYDGVAYATNNWVSGVAAAGTFTKPLSLTTEYGDSRIPTGWTVADISESA